LLNIHDLIYNKVLRDLQVNNQTNKNHIIELKAQKQKAGVATTKRKRGVGRSDRDGKERALMMNAKQFAFEKCVFIGNGCEETLMDDPEKMVDDQDPLRLPENARVELPFKSLAQAYRAYLPPAFKDKAEDEETATKVSALVHYGILN
jgi:hypothetical protein